MLLTYSLSGMTVVTPEEAAADGCLRVEKSRLRRSPKAAKYDLKLPPGSFCYPALVNVHDHFRGNYLPRIGPSNGDFYLNWSYWERDLRSSPVLDERARITVDDMYQLSAYKNLFSGVVTANDHFPHEFNAPFIPRLPIRVISDYALAHECSSFDLKWGDGIEVEHRRAVERGIPFITHLEEGFDAESQAGVEILEACGCLDDHDVLIHCIGFSDTDVRKVKAAGATVVWCPASNLFMFNVTCKIRKMLQQGVNVAIGTDSTHTGSVNLLEEMRFARRTYRRLYGEELEARTILQMVTVNPARAFWIGRKTGSIEDGKLADLLVLRPRHSDPYEALLSAQIEDIELLLQEGTPILGSAEHEELFALRECPYTRVRVRGREMCAKGDPGGLLARVRQAVGHKKVLDYLPLDG
ncbi:MAG: amidohydrolase family protein [Spirochaetales bacterium]|nr:amidohydrolase family protein [Spirochaetales bacterium]